MDFFELDNYTEKDLCGLIETQAEESIHLDFKASGALEKSDQKNGLNVLLTMEFKEE